jgi:glycosyltransferase involved in cell wall biosynthesis
MANYTSPLQPSPAAPLRPRILLISDYLPQNATSVHGAFQRLRRHIDALQEIGEVDVIFLWPWDPASWNEEAKANLAALRQRWQLSGRTDVVFSRFTCQLGKVRILLPAFLQSLLGRRAIRRDADTLNAIAGIARQAKPDLVFAHRMGAILLAARALARSWPIVADFDDVEHQRMRRQAARIASWRERLRLRLAAWLTEQLEREALRKVRTGLVCSEADQAFFRPLPPGAQLGVLPNAAALQQPPAPASAPTALFVGMLRYWPNAEGLIWLVHEVWPQVRRALPAARLLIAGLGSDELGLADAAGGVETLGFAADLAALYAQARLAICPLHIASGTRIKIIEAAMFARPAVSTSVGAEGLAFAPGNSIAIADGTEQFARTCIDLLGNPAKAEAMGLAAREKAQRLYSPEVVQARLTELCRQVLAGAARASIRPAPADIR